MSISVTQKNKFLLDTLIPLYSGRVQPILSKEAFQFSVYKKEEILNLVYNYFSKCPLISSKKYKLNFRDFFYCKDYRNMYTDSFYKNSGWHILINELLKL